MDASRLSPLNAASGGTIKIFALGNFAIEVDGAAVRFGRKAPRKPLTVLKYLIAQGGEASAARIVDTLWPEAEGDVGANALDVALHRLRRIVGGPAHIAHTDGRLWLPPDVIWVDAFAFERSDGVDLYRGRFLPDDSSEAWSVPARERLHSQFLKRAVARGKDLEDLGHFEAAADHYGRCIDIDDAAEPLYQGLMRGYLALGRRGEGVAVHGRLQRILAARFGVTASPETARLLKLLRQK